MSTNDERMVSCNERDREILLTFKEGIVDSYGRISTWTTEKDCCAWEGIHCDNITRRVTRVELPFIFKDGHTKYLKGEMNLCILKLEFLSHLDLSDNAFNMVTIPSNHHNITHVSKLLYLDLSMNGNIVMDNLEWLSPFSSLKYLNLRKIDLHRESNWLHAVAMFPSLSELQLGGCKLNTFILNPSIEYMNLSSLITLDLSFNNFTSHFPGKFFNLTKHITYLDLRGSNIQGEILSNILNLRNLRHLYLSYNQLRGSIPHEIGQLSHIQTLDLYKNMLSGCIPPSLGNLSSLYSLSIGFNNFSGEISKKTFSKLNSLDSLDLSSLNVVFKFDFYWVPPFQLSALYLSQTNLGPNFPSWIYTQKSLESLDLYSSGISLVDRNKFVNLIETISYSIVLSDNSMAPDLSNITLKAYSFLFLDHNNFTGSLPNLSPMTEFVDFSYNSFFGSIPHSWKNLKSLYFISLWSNKLSGEVLVHLSQSTQLLVMNLGENEFSGTMPINMPPGLEVIILRANQFEGNIPTVLFNLSSLFHLDLAHNKLSGSIPDCGYNLTHMVTNQSLATWYGSIIELFQKGQDYVYTTNPDRRTIDLLVNSFSGKVPMELFRLVQVQTLNLSHNNFMGTIPKTIGGMKNLESLDLSNNMFYGEIPESTSVLNFLDYLNLSHNNLIGKIPIGTQLQSFDASSYFGNPNLCGAPLNNCTTEEENPKNVTPTRRNEDEDSMRESLYLGMGVGFAVGFWGMCGSLFLLRKWRHTYYQFVDGVSDKIYVTFIVMLNRFKRN
ncbi:LOW QUALITY PROTEIN: receptor-like protein EIX1 [Vicia villosa]|uniref:LOW QUALITY PROTEIN: receptor-like protein EIX1 n=1 Tax=Vicia villosa TaxID=3911 RepID=UPI00273BDE76|nr:LOW QUALITY PROTEIN: receptor-like protein EIX1 [Vicia villosa]